MEIEPHSFSANYYCRRCGQSQQELFMRRQHSCFGGGKVVGISHLVRGSVVSRLCEETRNEL